MSSFLSSETEDGNEKLIDIEFQFDSVTPEHREFTRRKMLSWEIEDIDSLPTELWEFVGEVSKICNEKDLVCIFEQFRCDDIRELWELSSSSETSSLSSEDSEPNDDLWRGKVSLSRNGKVIATGEISYLSYPSIRLFCDPPIESKKYHRLGLLNLREGLDKL